MRLLQKYACLDLTRDICLAGRDSVQMYLGTSLSNLFPLLAVQSADTSQEYVYSSFLDPSVPDLECLL